MANDGLGMHTTLNTEDFEASLDRMQAQAEEAVELSVRRGTAYLVRQAQEHAPVGKSVTEPRHVGGTLRRSIRIVEVKPVGRGRWVGTAGPAVKYGRQADLGGTIHAKGDGYLKFQIDGHWVQVKEVTQTGSFFMEHGLSDTKEAMPGIIQQAWREKVRG